MGQHGLQGGADTRWASMACRGGLTPGGPAWLAGGADTRWASMACREGGGLTPGGPAWLAGGGGADTR